MSNPFSRKTATQPANVPTKDRTMDLWRRNNQETIDAQKAQRSGK